MSFDDVVDHIGGAGTYQVLLYLLLGLPSFFGGYQSMSVTFLGPDQDHWCLIERLKNYSHAQQKYIGIPYNEELQAFEHCHYYDLPYGNYTEQQLWQWNRSQEIDDSTPIKKCSSWVYDFSEYSNTALNAYDLVCDNSYKLSLVYSSYMAATVMAGLIAGPLSDKFGRKTVLVIAASFQALIGVIAAYAPEYYSFIILRFLMAVSLTFASTCCFVLSVEVFGTNYRATAGGLYWLFWSFGFSFLPFIAYFIRDFRKLQLALAIPMVSTLCYFFLVNESPRWCAANNKNAAAEKTLKLIAKVNKKDYPANALSLLHEHTNDKGAIERNERESKITLTNIFTVDILRKHVLVLTPGWISCTLIYYGMSFNTGTLAGNVYLNTFLSGLVEIPSYIGSLPLMYKFGRKYTQMGALIFSGGACLVCIPLVNYPHLSWLVTTFMLLGKAGITVSFAIIFVYTAELFPTPVRHLAIGMDYMLGNLFGLVAPFMGPPLMAIWKPLPLVIFGTLGTVSGLLILLLPETLGKKLADTIEEVRQLWLPAAKPNTQEANGNVKYIQSEYDEKTYL